MTEGRLEEADEVVERYAVVPSVNQEEEGETVAEPINDCACRGGISTTCDAMVVADGGGGTGEAGTIIKDTDIRRRDVGVTRAKASQH